MDTSVTTREALRRYRIAILDIHDSLVVGQAAFATMLEKLKQNPHAAIVAGSWGQDTFVAIKENRASFQQILKELHAQGLSYQRAHFDHRLNAAVYVISPR